MINMTQEIEFIKQAIKEATPGPWKVYEQNDERLIGTAIEHPQLKAPSPVVTSSVHVKFGQRVYINEKNAYLIANTPTWLASLITTIESKGEQLETCKEAIEAIVEDHRNQKIKTDEWIQKIEAEARGYMKENEQLRHRDRVVSLTNETLGRYVREGREQIESLQKEVDELSKEEVTISFTCELCEGTGYNDVSGNTGVANDVDSCEQCIDGSNDAKFTHEDIAKMFLALQQYADKSNWVHEDVWDGGGNPCTLAQSTLSHIQEGNSTPKS
jgi:hypothetical protein